MAGEDELFLMTFSSEPLLRQDFTNDRDKLSQFTVAVDGDSLKIESSDPPGASGTVSFTACVPDAERWRAALTACGAKAA